MQKSRFLVAVAAVSGCICLQLGAGVIPSVYGRSLAEIKRSKEIRICLAGSGQDFYRKNGAALAAYLDGGIRATYVSFTSWNDQFVNRDGVVRQDEEYTPEPLASGKCDLYPNDLARLDWRERKLAYVPLFISRNTILVSRNRKEAVKGIADLAGKTAAVMKGTSYHTWLENQNATIFNKNPVTLTFMPQDEAIKAAESGRVDFAITGADGALWAVKNFAPQAHVAFPVGATTEYGWCFAKKDTDLQEAVRRFFDTQRSSPDSPLNKNWKDYIGLTLGEFILFVTSTPVPAEN